MNLYNANAPIFDRLHQLLTVAIECEMYTVESAEELTVYLHKQPHRFWDWFYSVERDVVQVLSAE